MKDFIRMLRITLSKKIRPKLGLREKPARNLYWARMKLNLE